MLDLAPEHLRLVQRMLAERLPGGRVRESGRVSARDVNASYQRVATG
jgi:hypothetical protein